MSDDDKTPRLIPKRRMQTATERDVDGMRARQERNQATPTSGIPAFVEPEDTGVHARVKALSAAQITLGAKVDAMGVDVADLRVTTARSEGKLDVLVDTMRSVTAVQTEQTVAEIGDAAHRKRVRRETIGKIVAGVLGGGTVMEILHRLGVL